jgi:tetratricopeptide (TPR) repeat protein
MHRSAQKRIAVLREAAAIEQYEQMQPQLDAITEAYTSVNSTMTDEQYRAAMADVRAQFNVAQTMAGAKFERDVILEVQGAAQARLDEANGLEAGAKIEQALSTFDKVLTAYSKGEASTEDVLMAQQTMQQDTAAIRQEYGIPLDSDEEIRQYRKQMAAFKKAMKARIEFDDEQRQIDAAEASGTLHELPAKLQKRAIDAHKETVRKGLDEQARKGALEGDALYTEFESQMADYYARTGTVDPVLERTVNGFLAGGLVDKNGEPRAEYIEAAEQYRMLHERSPTVADRYIRTENRSMLDAVLDIAAGGDLAGAVRTVGVRQSLAPRAQTTADFMADPGTVLVIDSAVSNYLDREEIGVAQALTQRDADLQQTLNRSWFDQFGVQDDANRELLTGRVTQEVAQAHAREPLAKPSELVRAATRRVQERTPIIGGIAVPLPGDGPSAGEMFFGARAADFSDQAGAINDAVMDHFRTPEFRERYGFVDDTTFRESLPTWLGGAPETQLQTLWTGVRPFQTYWDSGSKSLVVQFALPGGGYSDAIALDTRKIGQQYIKKHTANAAD